VVATLLSRVQPDRARLGQDEGVAHGKAARSLDALEAEVQHTLKAHYGPRCSGSDQAYASAEDRGISAATW
jgi:hypothetical protein